MSMAIKYGLMKRAKKLSEACQEHGMQGCEMCHGGMMAEGGEVTDPDKIDGPATEDMAKDEEADMIGRIMKQRYAKGGMVKKEEEPLADFESNDFDAMDQMDPGTDADYTGANSGDEIGNEQEDDDRRDIVSRIMKSRAKKDRMPRPA